MAVLAFLGCLRFSRRSCSSTQLGSPPTILRSLFGRYSTGYFFLAWFSRLAARSLHRSRPCFPLRRHCSSCKTFRAWRSSPSSQPLEPSVSRHSWFRTSALPGGDSVALRARSCCVVVFFNPKVFGLWLGSWLSFVIRCMWWLNLAFFTLLVSFWVVWRCLDAWRPLSLFGWSHRRRSWPGSCSGSQWSKPTWISDCEASRRLHQPILIDESRPYRCFSSSGDRRRSRWLWDQLKLETHLFLFSQSIWAWTSSSLAPCTNLDWIEQVVRGTNLCTCCESSALQK